MIERYDTTSQWVRGRTGRRSAGFTLIELLVAIAVTAVLLVLIFGPLVQSFFFTGQAQTEAAAQSTARTTLEQITRELGSAAGIRNTDGKYLNMLVMDQSGQEVLARSYQSYMDIIPPRPQASANAVIDPTIDPNNPTVTLNTNTGAETTPPLMVSIAPGTRFIRYFIGLRYPIDITNPTNGVPQPYRNTYEVSASQLSTLDSDLTYKSSFVAVQSLLNTYVLYRAEVQPRIVYLDPTTGDPVLDSNGHQQYVPNYKLFASVYGPGNPGNVTPGLPEPDSIAMTDPTAQPVLDDPNFYRVVTTTLPADINPITSVAYTSTEASDHNAHVYNWTKIATPVINAAEADLLAPPRDARGNIQYYVISGSTTTLANNNPAGMPSNSYETDSTGTYWIEPTTVRFGPALITNDTLAATTSENVSQGYGANAPSAAPNLPYIATVYKAAYGQWQGTPDLAVYENDATGNPILETGSTAEASNGTPYFSTGTATSTALTATFSSNANLNRTTNPHLTNPLPSDVIEYDSEVVDSNGNPTNPVYDVTQSVPFQPLTTNAHYVALTLARAAAGQAVFGLPATPTSGYQDPNNTLNSPYWLFTVPSNPSGASASAGYFLSAPTGNYEVDFGALTGSYLTPGDPNNIPGAQMVVNSDRVYGPDMALGSGTNLPANSTSGPPIVPYTRVPLQPSTALVADQYCVNYQTGEVIFAPPPTVTLPSGQNGGGPPAGSTLQIAFYYQNNLNTTITPYVADTVRASYDTGSLTQVTMGIRLYAPNNHRQAFFSLAGRVVVANASR